jgi:hypothetical protein
VRKPVDSETDTSLLEKDSLVFSHPTIMVDDDDTLAPRYRPSDPTLSMDPNSIRIKGNSFNTKDVHITTVGGAKAYS